MGPDEYVLSSLQLCHRRAADVFVVPVPHRQVHPIILLVTDHQLGGMRGISKETDGPGKGVDAGFWSHEDPGCMMVAIANIEFHSVEDNSLVSVWICLYSAEVGLESNWHC